MSNSRKTYILSGLAGTGKSAFLGDCRLKGAYTFRTFNKFLLDVRFGYQSKGNDFLIMDSFMQAFHIMDFMDGMCMASPLVIERAVLDQYFYLTKVNGYEQSKSEIEDMNHIIRSYFKFVSDSERRDIVIVDMWNRDPEWISTVLSEDWTRSSRFKSVDDYLKAQEEYKSWYFSKLDELEIKYTVLKIDVKDAKSEFTAVIRRKFIDDNITHNLAY